MPDEAFERWRQAQQALLAAERNLLLASDPSSAAYAGASHGELQARVQQLKVEADLALKACLVLTERARRRTGTNTHSQLDSR